MACSGDDDRGRAETGAGAEAEAEGSPWRPLRAAVTKPHWRDEEETLPSRWLSILGVWVQGQASFESRSMHAAAANLATCTYRTGLLASRYGCGPFVRLRSAAATRKACVPVGSQMHAGGENGWG